MLKYMENLFEVRNKRNNVSYVKNSVMYSKWRFQTSIAGYNGTYAPDISEDLLKEIFAETADYNTILQSDKDDLALRFSNYLDFDKELIVYHLQKETPFKTSNNITLKQVTTDEQHLLWSNIQAKCFTEQTADFIYESFKGETNKDFATYFIAYDKDGAAVGGTQIIRGAGISAVYWVCILEQHRNKGYGLELVQKTLNFDINNGHHNFLLTASDLGLIIYKKLGFTPKEKFYCYNLKR